jgi:hypothetical protein
MALCATVCRSILTKSDHRKLRCRPQGEQLPITTLVQPSFSAESPDARYARPFNTAKGVVCDWWISKLDTL